MLESIVLYVIIFAAGYALMMMIARLFRKRSPEPRQLSRDEAMRELAILNMERDNPGASKADLELMADMMQAAINDPFNTPHRAMRLLYEREKLADEEIASLLDHPETVAWMRKIRKSKRSYA